MGLGVYQALETDNSTADTYSDRYALLWFRDGQSQYWFESGWTPFRDLAMRFESQLEAMLKWRSLDIKRSPDEWYVIEGPIGGLTVLRGGGKLTRCMRLEKEREFRKRQRQAKEPLTISLPTSSL